MGILLRRVKSSTVCPVFLTAGSVILSGHPFPQSSIEVVLEFSTSWSACLLPFVPGLGPDQPLSDELPSPQEKPGFDGEISSLSFTYANILFLSFSLSPPSLKRMAAPEALAPLSPLYLPLWYNPSLSWCSFWALSIFGVINTDQ